MFHKLVRKFTTMIFFLFFLATSFSPSAAGDTIIPTQQLADGQILVSAGGRFALGFFSLSDATSRYIGIWYNKISVQTVVWVANRQNPITDTTGALALTSTGSLVIRAQNNMTVWLTNVTSMRDPVAQLLDNGNFVVRDSSRGVTEGGFAWQSFDHPTDMLLPGMKLGFDLANGLNRSLTAWTSNSNLSPGSYSLMLDIQKDPQVVLRQGSNQLWCSGYFNGLRFSGMPEMRTNHSFNFTLVRNLDEVYFMFNTPDSIISRMVVTSSGTIELLVWGGDEQWLRLWFAPGNQCDAADVCGPYGLCDDNFLPVCSCLQGFVPNIQENWVLGCVREVPLNCTDGTDKFVTVKTLKLPDVSGLMLDFILSLEECKAICSANCTCTGYASADIRGNGSGCMIWTAELTDIQVVVDGGHALFMRLASADSGFTSQQSTENKTAGWQSTKQKTLKIPVSVGVILGMLLLSLICCIICMKKKKRGSMFSNDQWNDDFMEQDLDLPILDLNTIMTATNNFSVENKLGEGGFGPVYKGKLGEGQDVAVKRLAKTSIQGIDEFKNEVVLIAKLQHRNLVRLLGCCIQGEEKILVYEYMPNKSLDSFLFDKTKAALLDWQTRYRIIVGIARGLLYLHQDSRFRIIHRDLKAGNILLDKEMNPKISDFGMARIFGGDESEASTRRVVGTYGYMSPEYVKDGIFSVKSDVFSYGVLMLEIISGKRNRGNYIPEPHENLLGYAWNFWRDGNGPELVDKSMDCSSSMAKVLRCINVGLLCVQERPEDRPTMPSVALMLSSDDGQVPQPKKPGFVTAEATLESNTSRKESYTINEVTVTILDGR